MFVLALVSYSVLVLALEDVLVAEHRAVDSFGVFLAGDTCLGDFR